MHLYIIIAALLLSLTGAKAQEAQPFQAIWCDTPEQIERVVSKGTELGGAWEGIQAVNAEVKEATGKEAKACVFTIILGVRGKDVKTIDTPEGKLAIVPFLVVAVQTPLGMMETAADTVWFTLADPAGQGV